MHELDYGIAGEYLVCFDLAMSGYKAFPSDQGLPFDLVLEHQDKLLKMQVKSSIRPRTTNQRGEQPPVYIFGTMVRGKQGKKRYDANCVDIFALAGLDERAVGYVARKDIKSTMQIRSEMFRGEYQSEAVDERIRESIQMQRMGATNAQIARHFDVSSSQIHKDLSGISRTNTRGLYFRDLTIERALSRLAMRRNRD